MRNNRWLAAAALAACIGLAACSDGAPPPPPPPEVEVVTVRPQPIANVIELPGRVQAIRTAEVRARVNGIIERRLFSEGTDVKAGQALFAIDPREMTASLNAAQAALARAQATSANAAQDLQRYQGLIADQAISKQEYDAAVARLGTAQADVAQARAQVESARLSLGYATVRAPIAGRAGRAQVTEGALVSASQGTLLTTIEQIDSIYVNFAQSSSDLLAVRRGVESGELKIPDIGRLDVELILEDGTPYDQVGHIDFLDLSIDEATGTAALRAEFPNPKQALLPGQFVRAKIGAGTRADGILVPQRAVSVTEAGGSVFVVGAKDTAAVRAVKLGRLQGGNWVIEDGLRAGDRVVVSGLQAVRPGQPVRIAGAASAKAAEKASGSK
ncbi:efflux RND transporter periplasmic adaptor subunit [Sphingosinicella soli]|uniref:Membrane fusion protein (Multidrug efflux system) n=1 Tax=Sphingosinicella soli TaxID=333708 RepID=A0A7W7AZV4_9SPHN|nr:efflux RND transporter periplasmic adaptor subunit [Sphingosinicella soli]MBB4631438.1 membrane fusion protein (multidrug efflux system) [Sphingosinicella soli]